MINTILFDLDGTLLPMDTELFIKKYFKALSLKLKKYFTPEEVTKHMWSSTKYMMKNMEIEKTNRDAFFEDFYKNVDHKAEVLNPIFDEFYESDFNKIKDVSEKNDSQKLQASHIMRLLISLWDVGTVFFTIYPQVFRHEKSSIYYKYIEPLSYCFSISFKILIITVYGFMKWYICKCLFCKVYLLDLSYNRNAKPMTGSNELRFNLTQIRG